MPLQQVGQVTKFSKDHCVVRCTWKGGASRKVVAGVPCDSMASLPYESRTAGRMSRCLLFVGVVGCFTSHGRMKSWKN